MKEKIDATDILRFFQSAAAWVKNGGKFVSEDLARKRAEVCLTCPLNNKGGVRGRCPTCYVLRAVSFMNEALNSRKFNGLTYCSVCGCDLNIKVNIPIDSIVNHGIDYPEYCWQRTEAQTQEGEGVGQVT